MLINLEGVRFLDAARVHVLLEAHQRHLDAGEELRIVSVSRPVRRTFEILGLSTLLAPHVSEQADPQWSLI